MISQDNIIDRVKRVKNELENISSTKIFDHQSVVTRNSWFGDSSYDVSVSIAGGFTSRFYKLTATTASGQPALLSFAEFYRFDNPNVMASPYYRQNMPLVAVSRLDHAPVGNVYEWSYALNSDVDPHTVYFKFLFTGTDDVTWVWQEL